MKIAVLGTGGVGRTIGSRLVTVGHEVRLGSRSAQKPEAIAWTQVSGPRASNGTYEDAAAFGELVFNCTSGTASVDALRAAGLRNLAGKILIDVSNPLDFSQGMPPTLAISGRDSLGETIQREFPETRVVKALNTVNMNLMVDPGRVKGDHELLIAGNDAAAKEEVKRFLGEWFGWKGFVDLGDITGARACEAWLMVWIRLWGAIGSPDFNLHIAR
jgi:8-hydroxy-5-deazaflavin:NADPH oxidoreductase